MPPRLRYKLPVCLAVFILVPSMNVSAQEIWSGLTYSFTKSGGSDPSLPENQDPISPGVVLSRGSTGGLINIASESGFVASISPEFTEWATDLTSPGETIAATNWADLTFTNWIGAYGGQQTAGSLIVGRNAVLHLIFEDVYLDIQFTDWVSGSGGGFSYMRAVPPSAEPSGDYDGNGTVDAADYTVWRDTLGQTATPNGSGADGDADGAIDADDYTFWKNNFGNTVPGGGSSALSALTVPEPTTSALAVLAAYCLLRRIRKRAASPASGA
jgi:hypothetical protein